MKRPSVFISYRRVSSAMLATLMAKELEAQRLTVFVDTRRLDGGGPFPRRLLDAIDKCDVFLCLLADDTLESNWVQNEITHAHARSKIMIPVFQESFQPTQTGQSPPVEALLQSDGIHILDVKNEMIDETIERIAQMIKTSVQASDRPSGKRVNIGALAAVLLLAVLGFFALRPILFSPQLVPTSVPSATPTGTLTPTREPTNPPTLTRTPIATATAELSPTLTPAPFDSALTRSMVIIVSVDFAWLRREPNINSPQLALIRHGEAVYVMGEWQIEIEQNQLWWKVRSQGVEGWVEQQSLIEVTPTPTIHYIQPPIIPTSTPVPPTMPPLCNYNAVCDAGESSLNCPSDCGDSGGLGTCNYDAICDFGEGEDHLSCPSDC